MRRVLLVLLVAVLLVPGPAIAAWLSTGHGEGTVTATSTERSGAPTVVQHAARVGVTWTAVTLANGVDVEGYEVLRHVAGSPDEVACTAQSPEVGCDDLAPHDGTATYGVVALRALWRGPESPLTTLTFDPDSPVTTLVATPDPPGTQWSTGPVDVRLSATDTGGSGVAGITYRVGDDDPVTVPGDVATLTVARDGVTVVRYHATDGAENVEPEHVKVLRVDSTPPSTVVSSSPAPNANGWNNTSPVRVTLTAGDASSGVTGWRWRTGTAGSWTDLTGGAPATLPAFGVAAGNSGTFLVQYQATDAAGLQSPLGSYTVRIDRGAPTAPATLAIGSDTGSSATDLVTKVAAQTAVGTAEALASVEVSVDGHVVGTGPVSAAGAFAVPTGPLTSGTHTLSAVTVDPAGNRSATARSVSVKVDLGAPTGAVTFPVAGSSPSAAAYLAGCASASTYDVCGTAADPTTAYRSGLWRVELRLQRQDDQCLSGTGGTFSTAACATRRSVTGTATWAAATGNLAPGSYVLTVWVTDLAGNETRLAPVPFSRL